jgi:hypothetical protein
VGQEFARVHGRARNCASAGRCIRIERAADGDRLRQVVVRQRSGDEGIRVGGEGPVEPEVLHFGESALSGSSMK